MMKIPPLITMDAASSAEQARWFEEEVQPHESALRRWLQDRFPSLTEIDDIIQESYAGLIRAHRAGRVKTPKAYLYATARNAAIDFFRRQRILSTEPLVTEGPLAVVEDRPNSVEALSKTQELDILRRSIDALPPRCRTIMTLKKIKGLPNREIAEQLGISINTVNAQLVTGLKHCREFLYAHGVLPNSRQ